MSTPHVPLKRVQAIREERKSSRRRFLGTAAASAMAVSVLQFPKAQPAAAQEFRAAARRVFVNSGPITILDQQPAVPYPSIINVSGMPGLIGGGSAVRVGIHGLTHPRLRDIIMCIVAPNGTAVWLMGSVGAATTSASGMELLIFDDAPIPFPNTDFLSGSYKPTNLDAANNDDFPFPAPTNVTSQTLGDFAGLAGGNLNGQWRLYVVDNVQLVGGVINSGWSLDITTTNSPPVARNDSYRVQPGETLVVRRPGVLRNDRDPDGDIIRAVPIRKNSRLGRLRLKQNGSLRFEAKEDVRGVVRFNYAIVDTSGLVGTARIKIEVRERANQGRRRRRRGRGRR